MNQLNGFDYFILGFKKYAQFSGRATRSEYWYFTLFYAVFYVITQIIGFVIGTLQNNVLALIWGIIVLSFMVATILPALGLAVRRLHDTNRSGWWYLLVLTGIGSIALVIFFCQKSDSEANRFGNVPDLLLGSATHNSGVSTDNLKQIEKLAELKTKGILTEEEFQRKKSELL